MAWAGTPAGFLAQVPREFAWQREVWAFAAALPIAVKSLAFLAAGVTYRAPALVSRRRVAGGLGDAIGARRRADGLAARRPGQRQLAA